jgi:exodeoxyribonuclease VIII
MNVMIDLETLGLNDKAPILSIGAVSFDNNEVTEEFYVQVDLESSMEAGLTPDASTIKFWMGQPKDAQDQAFSGRQSLNLALSSLANWLKSLGDVDGVWTNGNKDMIWLKSAYDATKLGKFEEDFFPYYKERDFRTAKSMLPQVTIEDEAIAHHAMYDARWQARYLIEAQKSQ